MNDLERLEEIETVLEELSAIDSIILIEGKKDRRALTNLGLNDIRVIEVQHDGGPIKVSERVSEMCASAVILTDWDDRGDRIAAELKHHLDAMCVRYDMKLRARLRAACVMYIKDVESLDSLYLRLKRASKENFNMHASMDAPDVHSIRRD